MNTLLTQSLHAVQASIEYTRQSPYNDIWQTYAESKLKGGDCEDCCLAMRELLLLAAISDHRIHLVAGKLKQGPKAGEHHMVLHCDGLVLDILEDKALNAADYFYRSMPRTYVLSYTGLYIEGHKWRERDQEPRWQRYQAQLKKNPA